jgi:hypothetical protein
MVLWVKERAFNISGSGSPDDAGHPIDFGRRVHPERYPGSIWMMIRILSEAKEGLWRKGSQRGTASPFFFVPPLRKADERKESSVKFGGFRQIPDPKIDMAERVLAHLLPSKW